jgi:hypothetical protein
VKANRLSPAAYNLIFDAFKNIITHHENHIGFGDSRFKGVEVP